MKALPWALGIGICLAPPAACAQPRAFPTAEGFGAYAQGGRGGRVVYVTTLDDYPRGVVPTRGSLRWACEDLSGPRTILFKVGGTIALTRRLDLIGEAGSFVTIAGQTAPGDGIQLTGHGLAIGLGAHDVIIRYLRIRVGWSGPEGSSIKDALTIHSEPPSHSWNVIVDHCSLEWAMDENANVSQAVERVTFQWCIFGEASTFSGPQEPSPCAGFLLDGVRGMPSDTYVTIHHCLFTGNLFRNPLLGQNGGLLDLVNNVITNWGEVGTDVLPNGEHAPRANIVGNTYARGKAFRKKELTLPILVRTFKGKQVADGAIHVHDNAFFDRPPELHSASTQPAPAPLSDDWDIVGDGEIWHLRAKLNEGKRRRDAWPVAQMYRVSTQSPADAERLVLDRAGVTHPRRDALDTRIIDQSRTRTGRLGFGPSIADHDKWPVLQGGTPPADKDEDGMPDAWETAHGLNPDDPKDGPRDPDKNGYTNLEEYLNNLVAEPSAGP